jgi:hypothetical protein
MALGCAIACIILGSCLVTGRPVDGGAAVPWGGILFINLLVSWTAAVLGGRGRPMSYAPGSGEAGLPPYDARAGRRSWLGESVPTWLIWAYFLAMTAAVAAVLGAATASGGWIAVMATWGAQVFLAAVLACVFALLCAVACRLSHRARLMTRRTRPPNTVVTPEARGH